MRINYQKYHWGLFGIILFRILLDLNYVIIISKIFEYQGFYDQTTILNYLISWVILLLPTHFILNQYSSKHIFFANAIVLLYLMAFLPGTSLMAFMPMKPAFFALYILYWFLIFFFAWSLKPLKSIALPAKIRKYPLYGFLAVFMLTVIYASWKYTGFRIHFNLSDVYSLRYEARTWDMSTLLSYFLPAAGSILPLLLVFFLFTKKKILAFSIAFVIFLDFSIAGHKSVLFKLFLVFLGYWLYNEKKISLYSWVLGFLSFYSILEFAIGGIHTMSGMVIRRVLYLPTLLDYHYYDYFSTHDFDYFRQSFLRHFGLASPYKDSITRIIGEEYFSNFETNANNGLFSDAYMNFGVVGTLIFPFLLVFLLRVMDSVSRRINPKLIILPIITTVLALKSGTLSSVLLTGGILWMIICLMLLPKDNALKTNYV